MKLQPAASSVKRSKEELEIWGNIFIHLLAELDGKIDTTLLSIYGINLLI